MEITKMANILVDEDKLGNVAIELGLDSWVKLRVLGLLHQHAVYQLFYGVPLLLQPN